MVESGNYTTSKRLYLGSTFQMVNFKKLGGFLDFAFVKERTKLGKGPGNELRSKMHIF